jgi:glutaredoxin-like protein
MHEATNDAADATLGAPPNITVYWRPGCGFCGSLLRQLDRYGLPYDQVNIWEHPEGAAFVRSVARGNETVPTVSVGATAMVNPTIDDIVELLA